jgi:hypothetical protein
MRRGEFSPYVVSVLGHACSQTDNTDNALSNVCDFITPLVPRFIWLNLSVQCVPKIPAEFHEIADWNLSSHNVLDVNIHFDTVSLAVHFRHEDDCLVYPVNFI